MRYHAHSDCMVLYIMSSSAINFFHPAVQPAAQPAAQMAGPLGGLTMELSQPCLS